MKFNLKTFLVVVVLVAAIAGAFVAGMYSGAGKVRDGLLANYPLFKTLISNAQTEVDSVITISLSPTEDAALYNFYKGSANEVVLTIPYRAKYGMDLEAKNFKTDRKKDEVELILPRCYLMDYNLAFDDIKVNGINTWKHYSDAAAYSSVKPALNERVRMTLEKHKEHIKKGKHKITVAAMWFLMPYKFKPRVFFDGQEFPLPQVPGLNKDVTEYLKEQVGK